MCFLVSETLELWEPMRLLVISVVIRRRLLACADVVQAHMEVQVKVVMSFVFLI